MKWYYNLFYYVNQKLGIILTYTYTNMYDVLATTLKHTPNRIDAISFFLPHLELVGCYFSEEGLTLDHSSESTES